MICSVYIGNYLFFDPNDSQFDNLLQKNRELNLTLEKENDS